MRKENYLCSTPEESNYAFSDFLTNQVTRFAISALLLPGEVIQVTLCAERKCHLFNLMKELIRVETEKKSIPQ